ncbi:hypothetical protein NQ318_009066 [Aromia moschata]|uniref:Uncharacterized protein n=1 Tax=Aromia moschata TaxID=1265417 RepID=A0AAV8YUJ5_9CUCU|nr:hypothetical protein NQ318_009066 [Aromia moschata]
MKEIRIIKQASIGTEELIDEDHSKINGTLERYSKPVVSKVYYKASNVAENFIRSNIAEWQIGGPGILVTVDTYPEGCANTNPIRMSRPILCITEVKSVPQKYWLETLPTFDAQDAQQIRRLKDTILLTVRSLVRPGSILITPHVSTLCSHSDFDCLKSYYPVIVSTMDLARHNDGEQNVFLNLATIWRSVLDVCEEAQFYNSIYIRQFIVSHMWRRRYRDRSFEVFLYQLSLMQ